MRIIYVLFALFFISCSSKNPPNWYMNVDNNNNIYYGIGEGSTLELAKANARLDLARSIKVNVSSTMSSSQILANKDFSSISSQNINQAVDNMELNEIKESKKEHKNDTFYVKVELNKAELLQRLNKQRQSILSSAGVFLKNSQCNILSRENVAKLTKIVQDSKSIEATIISFGQNVMSDNKLSMIIANNKNAKISFNAEDSRLNSLLTSEYSKLYTISNESGIRIFENSYSIKTNSNGTTIELIVTEKGCAGEALNVFSIASEGSDINTIYKKLAIRLYNKLNGE